MVLTCITTYIFSFCELHAVKTLLSSSPTLFAEHSN